MFIFTHVLKRCDFNCIRAPFLQDSMPQIWRFKIHLCEIRYMIPNVFLLFHHHFMLIPNHHFLIQWSSTFWPIIDLTSTMICISECAPMVSRWCLRKWHTYKQLYSTKWSNNESSPFNIAYLLKWVYMRKESHLVWWAKLFFVPTS